MSARRADFLHPENGSYGQTVMKENAIGGSENICVKAAERRKREPAGGKLTRHIRFARDACRGGGRTRRAAIRQTRGRFSSRVGVDTRRVDSRRGGLSTTRADPTAGPLGTAGRMNHNPRPGTGNGGSEATLPAVPTFVAAGNKEFPTKAEGENARGLARDAPASFATRGAPVPARPRVGFFSHFLPEKPAGRGIRWWSAYRHRARSPTDVDALPRSTSSRTRVHTFASPSRCRPARSSRRRDPRSRAGLGATFRPQPLHDFENADAHLAPNNTPGPNAPAMPTASRNPAVAPTVRSRPPSPGRAPPIPEPRALGPARLDPPAPNQTE